MVFQLIHNVSLLVTLAVARQIIERRLSGQKTVARLLKGVFFGAVGILGMMTPVKFAPGVIYDARSIILTVAGLFDGPLPTSIAAVMCAAFRIYLGGAGAKAGVAVIVEAVVEG